MVLLRPHRTVLAVAVCAALAGCNHASRRESPLAGNPIIPQSHRADPELPASDGRDIDWPFWPQSMRVHPLSQFANDRITGRLLIEARVEFLDAFAHTCKGVGHVRIDLHDADEESTQPISTWILDLRDVTINLEHYDDLTRTYLFRLEVDPDTLPDKTELWAYFQSTEGKRMESSFLLPRPVMAKR